jgi:hypothetical protein
VPEYLAPYGAAGTNADADFWRPSILCLPVAHATGQAGDVFLCHPFIVHTATWPHRGSGPRMLAQPAIHVRDGFDLDGSDRSPVARAIVAGLDLTGTVLTGTGLTGTGLPSGAGSPGRRPPG